MLYLLYVITCQRLKKSSSQLHFFLSCANEVKTCGLVQQLIMRVLRDLMLHSRDSHSLIGDPPLDKDMWSFPCALDFQAHNQKFLQGRGGFVKLRHFNKHSRKKAPQAKFSEFLLLDTLKTTFWMVNLT